MVETSWRKNNVLRESSNSPDLNEVGVGTYYDHNPNQDTEEYKIINSKVESILALIKEARKNLRKDSYTPTSLRTSKDRDYLRGVFDKIKRECPEFWEADNYPDVDDLNVYNNLEYLAKGLKYLNAIMLACPHINYRGKDKTYKKAYFPELQHPVIKDLQEKIYDILTE